MTWKYNTELKSPSREDSIFIWALRPPQALTSYRTTPRNSAFNPRQMKRSEICIGAYSNSPSSWQQPPSSKRQTSQRTISKQSSPSSPLPVYKLRNMVTVPSICQDVKRVCLKTAQQQQHSVQLQRPRKTSGEDMALPLLVPKVTVPHHTQSAVVRHSTLQCRTPNWGFTQNKAIPSITFTLCTHIPWGLY